MPNGYTHWLVFALVLCAYIIGGYIDNLAN